MDLSGLLLRLGAGITVLAVVLDPFAQLLVQLDHTLEVTTKPGHQEFAPRAIRYSKGFERFAIPPFDPCKPLSRTLVYHAPGMGELLVLLTLRIDEDTSCDNALSFPDYLLETAVIVGLSATEKELKEKLRPIFPTGYCAWNESYVSLAVCSRCKDVSSDLKQFPDNTKIAVLVDVLVRMNTMGQPPNGINETAFQLPNGRFISNEDRKAVKGEGSTSVLMTTFGTGDPEKTNKFKDLDTLIWSMTVLRRRDSFNVPSCS